MIHFDNRIVYANLTPYGYTQIQETCEDKNVWYLYGNLPKRTYPSNAKSYGKPQFMKGVSVIHMLPMRLSHKNAKRLRSGNNFTKMIKVQLPGLITNSPEKKDNDLKSYC